MDTLDALLDMIDLNGGRITGRTAIQKLGYFSKIFSIIHPEYRAHYYGPYSADVAEALDDLVHMGFIEKDVETWQNTHYEVSPDWRRYRYKVTDDGRKYLIVLRKQSAFTKEEAHLREIIDICKEEADLDPYILSWAAKVHFILSGSGTAMTCDEVQKAALELNWDLDTDQINRGITLLEKLTLLTG